MNCWWRAQKAQAKGKPKRQCLPTHGSKGQECYLDQGLDEAGTLSIISLSLDGVHLNLGALLVLVAVVLLVVVLVALVLLVEALGGLHPVGLLLLELLLRGRQQP